MASATQTLENVWALLLGAALAGGCFAENKPVVPEDDPGCRSSSVVMTQWGPVKGKLEESAGHRVFWRIPFAAPPVGDLRWKPPQPPAPWTEERNACELDHVVCPQPNPNELWQPDEDCLTVSVWTPFPVPEEKVPVMVWIHTSGFSWSTSHLIWSRGHHLAANNGVIVVALEYRLGALGFLAHPDLGSGSGNFGFLDQQAALEWVRDNISAFGGDPNNVTIFGRDAGAASVCTHLVAAGSEGLFHRGIMQGGNCRGSRPGYWQYQTEAQADMVGMQLAEALECGPQDAIQCMRTKTHQQVIDALPIEVLGSAAAGVNWHPTVDGEILRGQPADLMEAGEFRKVPLIVGTNEDEGTLFYATKMRAPKDEITETIADNVIRTHYGPSAGGVFTLYPFASFDSAAAMLAEWTGDVVFSCPTRIVARATSAAGAKTYLYRYTHVLSCALPHPFLGAFYQSELSTLFHTTGGGDRDSWCANPLSADDELVSSKIQGYWTRFAKTGDPNMVGVTPWPEYNEATDQHLVIAPTVTASSGLKRTECDFFDALQ